jgi:hypothetical protein
MNYQGDAAGADATAHSIRGLGRRALAVQADIANVDNARRLVS